MLFRSQETVAVDTRRLTVTWVVHETGHNHRNALRGRHVILEERKVPRFYERVADATSLVHHLHSPLVASSQSSAPKRSSTARSLLVARMFP